MEKIIQNEKGKAWLWLLLVVAVAVVLVLVLRQPAEAPESAGPALSEEDTTAAIEKELQATDFGDIEAELEALEADLQSL